MSIEPTTVDFETFKIRDRPLFPPVPVGVSIKRWHQKPHYYAWGHPSKNNSTWAKARAALAQVWDGPLLFHNAKFDVDVAEARMDLPLPAWDRVHDTMFLLFLDDPHQMELGLKPSAERLLGMKPEERDAVAGWLTQRQPLLWRGVKISVSPNSEHRAGAYIAYAPGDLVGAYADGDVVRTEALFELLHTKTLSRGMGPAYDRERRLMPILLHLERQGIRIDVERLEKDLASYGRVYERLTGWVRNRLKDPILNVDSSAHLVDALLRENLADRDKLGLTPKSKKPKADKESLRAAVTDRQLLGVLQYRTQLGTCLHTFMEPWFEKASVTGGLLHTVWNQTKLEKGDGTVGTRTGRLSSTPNLQNIPKEFAPAFTQKPGDGFPEAPFELPALPIVRRYVVPWASGEVLVDRDYSQQEPRILAHFEDGDLMRQYQSNPWIDFHSKVQEEVKRLTGRDYPRKFIKIVSLGVMYGKGVGLLAAEMGTDIPTADEVKSSIMSLYPALRGMQDEMRRRMVYKKPIRTWGGREIFCEPPKLVGERMVTVDYKMVNHLIQGSAAECTKEALLRYWDAKPRGHTLYLSVHDELLVSAPESELAEAHEALREAMEGVPFDVPMLSEGKWGRDWAHLQDYDKKGEVLRDAA